MTAKPFIPAPGQAKQLRHLIASVISDQKSYKVPAVCTRYGLAEGTNDEAFSGKYRYVDRRLEGLSSERILEIAAALYGDEPNFELGELLAKIQEAAQVTELTRRRIVKELDQFSLSGDFDIVVFLKRLWPVDQMPSPFPIKAHLDPHFEDWVRLHAFLNDDLINHEILEALDIYACSQPQFFRVLEALVDPLIRTNVAEQKAIVDAINNHLAADGFHLAQTGTISGSPKYSIRPLTADRTPADSGISAILSAFDTGTIHERWQEALERRASNARGAITLARTLLEDTCKWILSEAGEEFADNAELPALYRQLAKILKLAPDDHTEQVFKQILGNCQSIVESLGSIRNKLGDAHSQGPKRARPLPRHAELAVNLAGTMATFLIATWEARQIESKKD